MPYTFGQFKADAKKDLFLGKEAESLVRPHDQYFVDALVNLQRWVKCLQIGHKDIRPHCSTFYNCGLTVTDAPQGRILKVSVVDKINPETGLEDADADIEYCSEIPYDQVEGCAIQKYMAQAGSCSLPLFFGLGRTMLYPPTDEGVDPGLARLPLGYHYPQTSTDRPSGRAGAGRWAIERGRLHVAPWIQSTEAVLIEWDGIKMTWADADLVDPSPMLRKAVTEYVRWQHEQIWTKDYSAAAAARAEFEVTRQEMIYDCHEQNRVRECETSVARGSQPTALYYNTEQKYTAQCPDNTTGESVTVTIAPGTVGSVISVADANQSALNEAKQQAADRLDCTAITPTYTNDQQSATAECERAEGAPAPDGQPKTVVIPAGQYTSTVSKEAANALALAAAESQAEAQLTCVWWNAAQEYTAECPEGSTGSSVTEETAEHNFSSTVSQEEADALALNAAKVAAESALVCTGSPTVYRSTERTKTAFIDGCGAHGPVIINGQFVAPADPGCSVTVYVTVAADAYSSTISQADANAQADAFAQQYANSRAGQKCQQGQCGTFDYNIP